jgi:hypothetical protein
MVDFSSRTSGHVEPVGLKDGGKAKDRPSCSWWKKVVAYNGAPCQSVVRLFF